MSGESVLFGNVAAFCRKVLIFLAFSGCFEVVLLWV